MDMQYPAVVAWRQAVDKGDLGLWDLRPCLETVHHSPAWKQRLGFPEPHASDSTHFWRCRVHPDDLPPMLQAMQAHLRGTASRYEATFRLRSNGSGYRRLRSLGRVVQWGPEGHALRIIGTMVDLTERPATPATGLPVGPRGPTAGQALDQPFHLLLDSPAPGLETAREGERLLGLVEDLLADAMQQLVQR
ncbi:MAG: PAS domain-containing protein [Aquincola sp.]|uniref:PAS domain-containing protein n=1 Tax=uncultured Aquincola sp. TaxID=886556 RepID=UPI0032B125E0|nr:PAS domain-containing protein [Aquincola sp.]|tara:strand:- start:306 stop:878 length:573 start_codon:yes stop_codon:yes gene_type:complete